MFSQVLPASSISEITPYHDITFPSSSLSSQSFQFPTSGPSFLFLSSVLQLYVLMSDLLRKPLLGNDKSRQKDNIRELFDLLGRKECNKHLLFFLLDLVVVRLVPELCELTPKELFELRAG